MDIDAATARWRCSGADAWREPHRPPSEDSPPYDLDMLEPMGGELWTGEVPLPEDLELLSELGRAEATAIRHLERSNEELMDELRVAEDADFRAAVEENLVVLQRKYARLADISERVSLGLLLRARCCAAERNPSSPSSVPAASPVRDSATVCLKTSTDSLEAAVATAMAAATPTTGDEPTVTAAFVCMQTLLRRVKRKASELEDDLLVGSLAAQWERKAARLHDGPRPSDDASAADAPPDGEGSEQERSAGGEVEAGEQQEGGLSLDASQAALRTEERLGALLRGVRRKAAELEDDVMAGSFCGLSLSEDALHEVPGADQDAGRGERRRRTL